MGPRSGKRFRPMGSRFLHSLCWRRQARSYLFGLTGLALSAALLGCQKTPAPSHPDLSGFWIGPATNLEPPAADDSHRTRTLRCSEAAVQRARLRFLIAFGMFQRASPLNFRDA